MSEEYKLSYTAKDIDEKLGKIDGAIQSPATATAGQGIAVEAVDGSGKPTSWKAVDLSNVKNVIRQDQAVSGRLVPTLVVEHLDGTYDMIGLSNINTDTILYPELSEDGVLSWSVDNVSDGMIPRVPDMPLATQDMLSELSAEKVTKPTSGNGTAGQFLVSDGAGGTSWMTVLNAEEVSY